MLVLHGHGEVNRFERLDPVLRKGERELQFLPRSTAWRVDGLRCKHRVRGIMPAEADLELNRALVRRGEENAVVSALTLDRQVNGLADTDFAPLQSHHVEVLVRVGGAAPARLVADAVVPVERKPGQRQSDPGGALEVPRWKTLAKHAQRGVVGFKAGVVQKLCRNAAEDGVADVLEKRAV